VTSTIRISVGNATSQLHAEELSAKLIDYLKRLEAGWYR
jgi:hypothetical protein